jgi:hypothetical protein
VGLYLPDVVAKRVVSSVIQRQVRYVSPVPVTDADGLVGEVYVQVADELKLVVPPVLMHSPAPPVLAAYWMLMRETLIAGGCVDRARKEGVAAAVSVANICPYCVDMHSIGIYGLASERDAEAIASDRAGEAPDPRIRDVAAWARVMHQPEEPAPPFTAGERAELVGVAVAFHYLTRVANVFLPSFLVPRSIGPAARRRFKHGVSWALGPLLRESRRPGRTLALLPDAPQPAGTEWAAGNAAVAAAIARSFAAFEAAGAQSLSTEVRDLVRSTLDGWRGEDAGLSRDWCEELVAELPEPDRSAGRLALLTALASYQVDEEVVQGFRRHRPDDAALVSAVAWAGFAAARRIGARQGGGVLRGSARGK